MRTEKLNQLKRAETYAIDIEEEDDGQMAEEDLVLANKKL
jgi:hypothetical protein